MLNQPQMFPSDTGEHTDQVHPTDGLESGFYIDGGVRSIYLVSSTEECGELELESVPGPGSLELSVM